METEHRDGKYYPSWLNENKRGGIMDYFIERFIFPTMSEHLAERKPEES